MESRPLQVVTLVLAAVLGPAAAACAGPTPRDRFFISGDGEVRLENLKTGDKARIRYRDAMGAYPAAARARIDRLFGIPSGSDDRIALRLVALLDYIEDRYRVPIRINSGYRSPEYNSQLRAKGRLAAKASLHMEGMASDIVLGTALAARAFDDMRALACCGVGYYHGESLHVDTGPARFWDETSSGVGMDLSSRNKLVMARTDRDVYLPGERIELRIARITDYPIGVSALVGVERDGALLAATPIDGATGKCATIAEPAQRDLRLTLPAGLPAGALLTVRLDLCNRPFPEMPERIVSNEFLVSAPTDRESRGSARAAQR
jgi:uncharacterized protein YcbK (DUF882 family)